MKKICVVLALLFAPAAGAAYKCVDENGVTQIGDTPPAACANVMMQEISSSGQVLRKIEPTPTPEQLKARLEEQSRKKEADKIAADQKRKDMALLSSFSAEREFDMTRDRNIEPLVGRIKNARERIDAIDKRIQELQDEMEFYKAGKSKASKGREAPMILVHQLERSQHEKEALEKSIVDQQRDIEVLKAKFDNDKKRWVALKSAQGTSPDAAPEAPAAAATPAKAEPQKKRN
jgi:chromosome segregation ATPase